MSKATEYAADTAKLQQHIDKIEEGTTEQILEYLALITGGYQIVPYPSTKPDGRWIYTITFTATNEDLGIEFQATSNGNATTIREAALFAVKGAIAWYQPWKEASDA